MGSGGDSKGPGGGGKGSEGDGMGSGGDSREAGYDGGDHYSPSLYTTTSPTASPNESSGTPQTWQHLTRTRPKQSYEITSVMLVIVMRGCTAEPEECDMAALW
eukprot:9467404-Pyramimonas_sp.AAC.2